MTRHIITILLCLLASNALAGSYYYTKPDATSLPPSGRILMYDPNTGTDKNITGQTLRDQVAPSTDETLTAISQPSDLPLSVQPATGTNPYQRKLEIRDANGKITMFVTANGTQVFGTPVSLAVVSVSPANGATGVDVNAVPTITFNKAVAASVSKIYLQGNSTAPVFDLGTQSIWYIPSAPLIHGTTYTVVVAKNNIVQTDGETSSSCGGAMTDIGGVCQSTFVTTPITITGSYPAAGASGITGTDGQPFDPVISVTLNTPVTGTTWAVDDCMYYLTYWTGSGWSSNSITILPTTSDNQTLTFPANYKKSYSSSFLTTHGISIKKRVGITTCPSGWTDTGPSCKFTFTTAP